MMSLQLADGCELRQSDRVASLNKQDMALYASTEPYEIDCPGRVEQLVLQIPRMALLERVPHTDLLTAQAISGQAEVGALVSSQLLASARLIGQQETVVQSFMQDTVLDLIATGLSTLSQERFEISRPERAVLIRAHALIHARLCDETLDRQSLAREMRMSVRSLARVFTNDGSSIASCIRDARLQRIAADLADPRQTGRSISEIMGRCGLMNFQHTSRQFREKYGMSPSAFRLASKDS